MTLIIALFIGFYLISFEQVFPIIVGCVFLTASIFGIIIKAYALIETKIKNKNNL